MPPPTYAIGCFAWANLFTISSATLSSIDGFIKVLVLDLTRLKLVDKIVSENMSIGTLTKTGPGCPFSAK